MTDKEYWQALLSLSSGRVVELAPKLENVKDAAKYNWLKGMILTNQNWIFISKGMLNSIDKAEKANFDRAVFRESTFRGNDDV